MIDGQITLTELTALKRCECGEMPTLTYYPSCNGYGVMCQCGYIVTDGKGWATHYRDEKDAKTAWNSGWRWRKE